MTRKAEARRGSRGGAESATIPDPLEKFRPKIEMIRVCDLKPSLANARVHSDAQIRQLAESIKRFGFTNPILVGDGGEVVAGHGRLAGAKLIGMNEVPVVRLSHLTATERRAYMLADNKLALNAGWDEELLASELKALVDLEFDVPVLGFSQAEVDVIFENAAERDADGSDEPNDVIPPPSDTAVTMPGDVWQLGAHRLVCGDARDPEAYGALLGDEMVDLIFTDPPYNVPIDGHVCGSGRIRHREFAMGVGEMSYAQFAKFLVDTLEPAAKRCRDGAIAFVCMDWRHLGELLEAGRTVFAELKNVCVWNKKNAGMGTFYRSKHELILVFKVGIAPHINNFGLGDTGRYRTNVWDYPGITSMGGNRLNELAMHPTVKPVALVADAIRDCTKRAGIVLDVFAGSGTTLIAARNCGRIARLIEYDPVYCDTIIRRYELLAGNPARLKDSGDTFESVAAKRQ